MENNWENELGEMLKKEVNLQEISAFLKSLKSNNITQAEVRESLMLRRAQSNRVIEDRILEILDVVEGYCQTKYSVW